MAAVPLSLPGDLRVRLRALRNPNGEIHIGMFFNLKGELQPQLRLLRGVGARHRAVLKRSGLIMKKVDAPAPATADGWVPIELQQLGGTITMKMDGKTLLEWTSRTPSKSRATIC